MNHKENWATFLSYSTSYYMPGLDLNCYPEPAAPGENFRVIY